MNTRTLLIADPGSCHCGSITTAKELVRAAKDCGCDMIKFQLFPDKPEFTASGNVPLPYGVFEDVAAYGDSVGIEVFASVFNSTAYKVVAKNCVSIKFSFKSCMGEWLTQAVQDFKPDNVFASGDVMNPLPEFVQRLYCVPLYPVPYRLDFEGIFKRFDGFSDHTLGISQTLEAVRCGAKIIEKHFRLDRKECDAVPDGMFAIRPKLMEKLALECHSRD